MTDKLGAMRARVTLQSPALVADEIGGNAISWMERGQVWASVSALGAGEFVQADAQATMASHRLTINRFDGVRAGWRVAWEARRLRIVGVVDDGGARVELICQEEIR